MASTLSASLCALAALVFWTAVGHPVARRLFGRTLALPFAPLAGWALHSVVALPIFFALPFTATTIAVVGLIVLAAAWCVPRFLPRADDGSAIDVRVSPWAWGAAVLVAVACAAAILPKHVGDAVVLSDQIFDHAKISMVEDMARLGLPPGNPFFADDGSSGRLSYYYLLHFSSAELTRLLPVSGWEADIAMTFFAAFTSLAAMMGLAVRFSARAGASLWVVAIAASSSSRVVLEWMIGGPALDRWFEGPGGFGGWLFQAPWVPQHLISTSCVLLAVLTITHLAAQPAVGTAVVLALVSAAAFESSTWVGGIDLALVAAVVVPLVVLRTAAAQRLRLVALLAGAGLLTALLASPFLIDQAASSALRHTGFPIAVRLSEVLGPSMPWRRVLDAPAFWLLLLPVVMPAAYVMGIVVLLRSLAGRDEAAARTLSAHAFAATGFVALVIAWLLVSTIADNNDLGWRAALLAATVLIVFAATGIARWVDGRRRGLVVLGIAMVLLGVPETFLQVGRNVAPAARPGAAFFARMPALWVQVREHTAPDERVANNPYAFDRVTPWPVNIGWSLLADRRSCYAGWELTQVFTAIPHDRLRAIDDRVVRVFSGEGTPDDVHWLANDLACATVVVTSRDGAWVRDPFAAGPDYTRVVDEADWRIYRRR